MSSVEAVGCGGFGETGTEKAAADLERFLGACLGGQDIEEIILRGAARQRKLAGIMRSAHRENQRKMVAEAARKIKDAAWKGVYSALFGAAVRMGVAYACYELDIASGNAQPGAVLDLNELKVRAESGLKSKLLDAGGSCFEKVTPWTIAEAEDRAAAEVLQARAGIEGQQAGDASEWAREVKELEGKLLAHLEKTLDLERQVKKTVIDRMGS